MKKQSDEPGINIVKLFDGEYPAKGGYQSLVTDLIPSLENQDTVEVDIICRSNDHTQESDLSIHPIILITSALPSKIGTVLCIFYNWIAVSLKLRELQPDVVHAHQVFKGALYALPCRLFNIPLVCTSHGSDIQINEEMNYGVRRNSIKAAIVWFTLQFVSRHVVVSEEMQESAIDAGTKSHKVRVINNGIDTEKSESLNSTQIEMSEEESNVLFLGRLIEKKRPSDLIKALAPIIDNGINVRLFMAGPGNVDKLKACAESIGVADRVNFLGFISDEEKWELFANCDMFVLPSETEGHPITLLEAGLSGLPVIVPEREPFTEFIRHRENGLLFAPNDLSSLSKAIEKLISDEELRQRIGRDLRQETERTYSIDNTAEKHIEVYKEVLRG